MLEQTPLSVLSHYAGDHHVIFDTDIGIDDVFALTNFTATQTLSFPSVLGRPHSIDVCAVSIVKGLSLNLEKAAECIQRIQQDTGFLKKGTKLFVGAMERMDPVNGHCFSEAQWYKDYEFERVHNELGDLAKLNPLNAIGDLEIIGNDNYVEEMIKLMEGAPDNYFTWFSIGPMTNLARLLVNEHHRKIVQQKLKMIVIMGGAIFTNEPANEVNQSETNFFCDGKAAKMVIEYLSEKVYLFELSVANLHVIDAENLKILVDLINKTDDLDKIPPMVKLRREFLKISLESCTYDTCTSTFLLYPQLFELKQVPVILYDEKPKEGIIELVENASETDSTPLTKIWCATKLNQSLYFELIKERVCNYTEYYSL